MTETTPELLDELELIEVADAWFEYLENTRHLTGIRYERAEPYRWTKLQLKLKSVEIYFSGRKAQLAEAVRLERLRR